MLNNKLRAGILRHASESYPEECCGLVVSGRYRPCANVSSTPTEAFCISPEDWAAAEDLGDITEVVHSHPDGAAFPSGADFSAQAATGLPWVIVALGPDGVRGWYEFGA